MYTPSAELSDSKCVNVSFGNGYRAAQELGWTLLDRHGITAAARRSLEAVGVTGPAALMRDHIHYWPFVQHEVNNVLLNLLCPYTTDCLQQFTGDCTAHQHIYPVEELLRSDAEKEE